MKYYSIEMMLNDLDVDAEFINNVKSEIDSHSLSKIFHAYRCFQNLSEKQMAEKLGVSLKEIQDLEDSTDEEIFETYSEGLKFYAMGNSNTFLPASEECDKEIDKWLSTMKPQKTRKLTSNPNNTSFRIRYVKKFNGKYFVDRHITEDLEVKRGWWVEDIKHAILLNHPEEFDMIIDDEENLLWPDEEDINHLRLIKQQLSEAETVEVKITTIIEEM
jgi:hypothetical protein